MGEVKQLLCGKCNYQKELYLGSGFLGKDTEHSIRIFPPQEQQRIQQWIAEHGCQKSISSCEYGVCDTCGAEDSYTKLTIIGSDQTTISYQTDCTICGGKYKQRKLENLICPKCKSALEVRTSGHWD